MAELKRTWAVEERHKKGAEAKAQETKLCDKLCDNVKVSLLSELPVKTSHILVMDRVDESVDENNALMSSVLARSSSRRHGVPN